jgi:hypothetical protein
MTVVVTVLMTEWLANHYRSYGQTRETPRELYQREAT